MKYIFIAISIVFASISCQVSPEVYDDEIRNPDYMHRTVKNLSDIIVHDIFSPPVASRIHAYTSIAAYECIIHDYPEYNSLAGQLNELTPLPAPDSSKVISFPVASIHAFMEVGKALIFSEDKMESFRNELYVDMKQKTGIPNRVMENSFEYGEQVAQHILVWVSKDNYKETRTFPKYSITDDPSKWKPTPPGYFDGIEPHWNKIRPLVLESSKQFIPPPPTKFDTTKGSKFYNETIEVYEAVKSGDDEMEEIARFWDCNPYVLNVTGHVMHATKKITPGGHWIGITRVACEKAEADIMTTNEAYTITSIALMDAFISCWDEKYRSNLIRPETVINEYIDEEWVPILQTPPFPEHTMGHSVISRAAAIALTSVFGDNFSFRDDVELEYGLPVREFDSFIEASQEAALSRLYGGIHYMPAIEYGVQQGEKVADYILDNIEMKSRS